ncbi:P-loop containing nucleoside triphosphate hydrolase protein [Lentinula detonsa]|uniref:P-loop containing nucleoside triphosphate hydrolase protein n=1 Tax=Lentinula detonsa TaxID=2804962 RepID=A0A9W8NW34_9AGAR|nr:P-loop containing nucleoside triphosphate hydrolase protein [Lentinula detonsa]
MANRDPEPSSRKAIAKRALEDADHIKNKKSRTMKAKRKETDQNFDHWPQYFHSLFKVYKALNTVLAFVTSRKQLATTFPSIRSSVENITKQPLDMSQVAELKAFLPEIITFAYVPRNQIQVNVSAKFSKDEPDFSAFAKHSSKEPEHVLLLEFAESWKGASGGTKASHNEYLVPATRTPAATKKLVEKRNDRFIKAVDELLAATSSCDDPVSLLKAAARDYIPVDPEHISNNPSVDETAHMPVPSSEDRVPVHDILAELQEQHWYKDQIVERRTVEPREGQTGSLDPLLSSSIQQALQSSRNIETLYSHQATAINALNSGKDVIVSTSTASGKSVIYQVPLLRLLENDPHATAIFVYPTKALAQDQKSALDNLLRACPDLEHIQVSTYDGDTPVEQRAGIRASASVIFTNFDMIHAAILPHEELWRSFLKNLRLFVADELHYYSGTFGSHVAQIMRRLRRVCVAVGNHQARFVSCSATIANPLAHMVNIFGLDSSQIQVVTEDGAPTGMKEYLIWRSPYVDEHEPALGRQSSIAEATALMRFLMKRGIRVILFCKIRKVCELAMKTLRNELSSEGRYDILERVQAYRGGYSAEERRRIEHDAFTGHLLGIIATNALELGVDIGTLDAVLMLGFPVTLSSFRQQAGRAGRRKRDSLAIFIAEGLPIDQYYLNNSHELFDKDTDDLLIDLDNEIILEAHIQCAAHEMPICFEDEKYFGPLLKEICKFKLHRDEDGWYHPDGKCLPSPSKLISIRGIQEDKYVLVDVTKSDTSAKILEEIEISRAVFEVYEGGIFIHQGRPFIVQEIHHDTMLVKLVQADVNWITKQRDFTDVNALQTYRIRAIKATPHRAYYGRVEIFCQVFGFYKMRHNVILDVVDVESSPWIHETVGMWIDVPDLVLRLLRDKFIKPAAAIHSAEHAFLNQFPLASDIRTECKAEEKEYLKKESRRKRPARLIMYDPVGHGSGVAAKAFEHAFDTLNKALVAVESCTCERGCVKCILSPSCKEGNIVSSKPGALAILKAILNIEINPDSIPFETDERALHGHSSVYHLFTLEHLRVYLLEMIAVHDYISIRNKNSIIIMQEGQSHPNRL